MVNQTKTSRKEAAVIMIVWIMLFLSFPGFFVGIGFTAVAVGLFLGARRALKRRMVKTRTGKSEAV